jgi:hypothetical protein
MPFQCPLCDTGFADNSSYVKHLADAHGLVDDEGAPTPEQPPAPEPPSVHEPPVAAAPQFAPLEPLPFPPPPAALPPPPIGWTGSPYGGHQLPPPPPMAVRPDVSKRTVALIVAGIVAVAVVAMVLVNSSGSTSTSRTLAPVTTDLSNRLPASPTSTTLPSPVLASSRSAADSVDPTEARSVATQLWSGMTDALHRGDTAALRVFEDGALLQADIGGICQVGCGPPTFSPLLSLTVNVPHQSGWPATFFATITYASGCNSAQAPCVNQFVAVQPEQGQPWKATLLIQYGGRTASMEPQLLPDGFAVSAADSSSAVPPLLADFASYYSAFKHTGQKPTETSLEDGPFTSDTGAGLYEPPEQQRARGVVDTAEYTVDPADPTYTFTSAGGGTTNCGTIRYTAVLTSSDGSPLPAAASIAEFGLRIADGSYASLTLQGLHMVCFDTRVNTPTVFVIASWGGNVAVTGERA